MHLFQFFHDVFLEFEGIEESSNDDSFGNKSRILIFDGDRAVIRNDIAKNAFEQGAESVVNDLNHVLKAAKGLFVDISIGMHNLFFKILNVIKSKFFANFFSFQDRFNYSINDLNFLANFI
jgi:hypothetical protein